MPRTLGFHFHIALRRWPWSIELGFLSEDSPRSSLLLGPCHPENAGAFSYQQALVPPRGNVSSELIKHLRHPEISFKIEFCCLTQFNALPISKSSFILTVLADTTLNTSFLSSLRQACTKQQSNAYFNRIASVACGSTMTTRFRTSNSLLEGRTVPAGGTVQARPGWVVDNDVETSIEGSVKSGRGHSLLIRMYTGNQCPITCELVAAGSYPPEALRDYRKLPSAREIRPLSSKQSIDDLVALKERKDLGDLRCVLVARQRRTASRAVILGYLTGEQERPLRQYWWTNLRRAFPTQAQRWLKESWAKGTISVVEEHGKSPTCVSDTSEDGIGGRNSAGQLINAGKISLPRRDTNEGHPRGPTMDGSPCPEPGIQTSITTENHAPSLEQMPGEILNMILEYSFDLGSSLEVPHQSTFNNILNVSQRLRAAAIDFIPKRARRLVAKSWLSSKEGRHGELFSSTVLQRIESIRLDLSNHSDEEVIAVESHIQRLASIWGERHMLSSVSVVVRPDWMRLFSKGDLHLVSHPLFTKMLSPLADLLGDKLTWEPHDFDGPSFPNGDSVLSFAASSEEYGHVLKLLLEMYHGDVNATRASFGYNALHKAVLSTFLDNARALLGVEGLDVDARDTLLRNTPLMNAAAQGLEDMVKLLLDEGKADIALRNSLDQTPLVIAEMARHRRIVDLLRNADAIGA